MTNTQEMPMESALNSGYEALSQGQFDAALEHGRQVLQSEPENAAALELMGVAYCQSQRTAKGLKYLRRVVTQRPDLLSARVNLANALQSIGEADEANSNLQAILELEPEHTDALTLHGNLLLRTDRAEEGEALLQRALASKPDHAPALNLLATHYAHAGHLTKAEQVFCRAAEAYPDHAILQLNHAHSLTQLGRLEEALQKLERTLEIDSELHEARISLISVLRARGDFSEAIKQAESALVTRPDDEQCRYLLCSLLEQNQQPKEAIERLAPGLKNNPTSIHLNLLMARCERRTGQAQQALSRLDQIQEVPDDHALAQALFAERGVLLDQAEQFEAAFTAFTQSNNHGRALWTDMEKEHTSLDFLEGVGKLRRTFTESWVNSWSPASPSAMTFDPIFVLSFPRSGTTLLNRMLAGHSDLQVYEEIDAIHHLSRVIDQELGGYPEGLATLSELHLGKLRKTYYEVLREVGGADPYSGRCVDKMPINTIDIGLIHRLFPRAHFLLVDRHPADVCLSCFMQAFQPNSLNANFFTLEDTFRCYSEVMALLRQYQQLLPINFHVVRYESLVERPAQTLQEVCGFVSIAYDERMLQYAQRARDVKTASYDQVAQPLYETSVGRWRNYSEQLQQLVSALEQAQPPP